MVTADWSRLCGERGRRCCSGIADFRVVALLCLLFVGIQGTAYAGKLNTGDDDDLSDLQVQRKLDQANGHQTPAAPTPQRAGAVPPGALPKHAAVLLVDDDESDNNNIPGDSRLSDSDIFYRKLLNDEGLAFDTVTVQRYGNGPDASGLHGYKLVLWYTGSSYGGNKDNTAVISHSDEESLRQYLAQGNGTVILISPGYLNNVLGGSGEGGWDKTSSSFLRDVMGVKGGRGLLQRFKDGRVTAADGTSFLVAGKRSPETQFSPLNTAGAQTVFRAELAPDAKGEREVAVATSHASGGGRMVYVGFTFENIAAAADGAFERLLQAAGPATLALGKDARSAARNVTVPEMGLTGAGPTSAVSVSTMSLSGAGVPASIDVPGMTLTGSGPSASVRVPNMILVGSELGQKPVTPR